jgi:hypothetical protein
MWEVYLPEKKTTSKKLFLYRGKYVTKRYAEFMKDYVAPIMIMRSSMNQLTLTSSMVVPPSEMGFAVTR